MLSERANLNHRHADLAPQIVLVLLIILAVAFKWNASADISADSDLSERRHNASASDTQ
ncbi:hypothetical protein SAMN04488026_100152 [Aliiruegeria lutimaris]|uniref:Uncharacterized protein n=1 Tax=Aliiruegeria lutimaris TaxID=571298 RepID=A0A1G8IKD6_9RHOB|nr:hypothetical protein SAMN04488026_100152 [Aliiruegeria lutimaris]